MMTATMPMTLRITFAELMSKLRGRGSEGARMNVGPLSGILQRVEREDGSGNCFNVELLTDTGLILKQFVRTID